MIIERDVYTNTRLKTRVAAFSENVAQCAAGGVWANANGSKRVGGYFQTVR